jgi:predicted DNA-binding transcriptional regulator YafY
MNGNELKRVSRLTSIVMQLQTKRLLTATQLAGKFDVSVRTIYRDIRALEEAGVPIFTEDGKGYTLVEGYKVPPVMFTESEANALITAEQLISKSRDTSLVEEYIAAITKIKAILKYSTKQKVDLLSQRIAVSPAIQTNGTSGLLAIIQDALTSFRVLEITYRAAHNV